MECKLAVQRELGLRESRETFLIAVVSRLAVQKGLNLVIDKMQEMVADLDFDVVLGAESRGFIFSAPIAYNRGKALVPVRKKGKLPCETIEVEYDLEYGKAVLELHKDAIKPGQKVLLVDDLMATGGTIEAMIKLVEKLGGEVAGVAVLMELKGLNGRERIKNYRLDAAISYEGK